MLQWRLAFYGVGSLYGEMFLLEQYYIILARICQVARLPPQIFGKDTLLGQYKREIFQRQLSLRTGADKS